jgi:hypothetical protein
MERRTVAGLQHLLSRSGVADYADVRPIDLHPEGGRLTLRYFVLNEDKDPDAYTTTDQALTITNNGQRQITKDRAWLKRHLDLPFLFRRLVVVVDGTELANATKREVFASTRESGVDTVTTKRILDQVIEELAEDENLKALDELARQRVLKDATKSTTEKVKRQLATQIAAILRGGMLGEKGGRGRRGTKRPPRVLAAPAVDDALMLEVPDQLILIDRSLRIGPGRTSALRLELNAKNDFLPTHADRLSVSFGPELAGQVRVRSKGRLLGGRVRITLEADPDAPLATGNLDVALMVPELGIELADAGTIEVRQPKPKPQGAGTAGGEPNVDVQWVGRDQWSSFEPHWSKESVGMCAVRREDPAKPDAITKVEWILNEAFGPYERVMEQKRLSEATAPTFKEGYELPILLSLFRQQLAREATEAAAEERDGPTGGIPDGYFRDEQARMARAVLMAMEPGLAADAYADAA